MEKIEEWKDVIGYKGLYQVSNNGVVRSLDRYLPMPNGGEKLIKGRIIKQFITPNGYVFVNLGKTHKDRKPKYVHRIVAENFSKICGDWFEECQVDHINCVRNDNRAVNLKVCTAKENSNNPLTLKHQSIRKLGKKMPIGFGDKISKLKKGTTHTQEAKEKISIALKGKKHSKEHIENNAKAQSIPIVQLDKNNNFIQGWVSATQVERELNIYHSNITKCCKGKCKSAGKYRWKYLQDYINEQIQYLNELKEYRNRLYDILKKAS